MENIIFPKEKPDYEALFENTTMGIIILNRKGIIEVLNPHAEKLLGYDTIEIQGQPFEKLLPHTSRHSSTRYREILFKRPQSRIVRDAFCHYCLAKSGIVFPVTFTFARLQRQGDDKIVIYLNKLSSGFTGPRELLMREQSIRTFLQHTPSAIAVLDNNMKYVIVSKRWVEDYKLSMETVIGRSHYDVFPDVPLRWREYHQRALKGETLHCDEDSFLRTDGKTEWVSWEICPWFSFSGAVGGIFIFSEVITPRKEAQFQLKKLNEELEEKVKQRTAELADALAKASEINALKSDFVALASHEFRTPLSAILSSATLAEKYSESGQPGKGSKHFQRIKLSVAHLVEILNDFLSLENLEQGKIKTDKTVFDLKEFVKNCLVEFYELVKDNQNIIYEYSGETEVFMDQKILRNIINNLISNAIKYSEKDIKLFVIVNAQQVVIEVKDQGIGIPLEDQKNLFGKFHRAKNAAYIQGTGLGLNIVKNYVDLMGGSISFSSEVGKGTTFTIHLSSNHGGKQLFFENL